MDIYFPPIARDKAWTPMHGRVNEVSHFSITVALQTSGAPDALRVGASSGMYSDQPERSGATLSPVRVQLRRRRRLDSLRALWLSMVSLPSDVSAWGRNACREAALALHGCDRVRRARADVSLSSLAAPSATIGGLRTTRRLLSIHIPRESETFVPYHAL